MKGLLFQLEKELEVNSANQIIQLVSQFQTLTMDSQRTDKLLSDKLTHVSISEEIKVQLEQRRAIQEEIVSLIKKTIPRATSIKSILASEVNSLKIGRTAMNGYKRNAENLGRIVNQSS